MRTRPPLSHSVNHDDYEPFEQWLLKTKLPQIRYMAFFTAVLYLMYALIEKHMNLAHADIRLWFHGVLFPLSLMGIIVLSRYSHFYYSLRVIQGTTPVIAAIASFYLNSQVGNYVHMMPEIYLNIIWTFTMTGLSLKYAGAAATITFLSAIYVTLTRDIDPQVRAMILLWTTSAYMFGFITAVSLERMHRSLYEQQKHLSYRASTDNLTRLWNRNKIQDLFHQEVANNRYIDAFQLSIIMLDIDHFKQVNDLHGHQAGDTILLEFSKLLKNMVRHSDHVARLGGEEFCIVLPHTSLEQAKTVAEKLRETIESHSFPVVGHKTASLGLAQYQTGENFTDTLNRADMAMYRAKNSGRNNCQAG